MTSEKRKLKTLTLHEKLRLIKEIDEGGKKKNEIAKEFGIPASTLTTIYKNRETIIKKSEVSSNTNIKRFKPLKYPDLDKCVYDWLKNTCDDDLPLSGTVLREKADDIAQELGYSDFKASVGWLDKFQKRHGLFYKAVTGETVSVVQEDCDMDMWSNTYLNQILKYSERDIFNADETGLFYKCLPNKLSMYKGNSCSMGEYSSERVTILLGANMCGTEKLCPLVIGKSAMSECLDGVKSLPVQYSSNERAWMTAEIFENWLIALDAQFHSNRRKIILLIDNCLPHLKVLSKVLRSIKVIFLPPNITSVIHPMGQGIIQNFKFFYRKRIMKKILYMIDDKVDVKINLLDCVREIHKAWMEVSALTIADCFKKAGFKKQNVTNEGSETKLQDLVVQDIHKELTSEDDKNDWIMVQKLLPVSEVVNFNEYVNIDNEVTLAQYSTDSIVDKHESDGDIDSDLKYDLQDTCASTSQEITVPVPSLKEATIAHSVFRRYVESQEYVPDSLFSTLADGENWLTREHQRVRHTKFSNFIL